MVLFYVIFVSIQKNLSFCTKEKNIFPPNMTLFSQHSLD